jgi:hypothetical protein
MKKFLLSLSLLISIGVFAQSDKYTEIMENSLKQYSEAKSADEMIAIAQKFERIAMAEKTQWLPFYYSSLIKARMSFMGIGGDKDVVADEAQALIEKAENLSKNNCEILCVKSMIATAKMLVDPQGRYMQYGMQMNQFLQEAKKADAENPRPYILEANNLINTPEQYGGGCNTSKPVAEKALELFTKFKPSSELFPNWGKDMIEQILNRCK